MSHTIECVTNAMPKIRACTIRDEHLPTCHDDHCGGCWPRPATRGYLCDTCFDRVDAALATADRLRIGLHGVDRAIQRDLAGARTLGPRVPLSTVALDLDAIASWQRHYRDDLLHWVSTPAGATQAINFARTVHTASKAHPLEEKPHRLPRTRCPRCNRLTLAWKPPTHFLDLVHISCLDDSCAFECDQQSFETIAEIEHRQQRKATA
jgi:hypothetical protein